MGSRGEPTAGRRACDANCSSASESTGRPRPTSSPSGSGPAGQVSSSSSARSNPRSWSAARPSVTASAGRVTCTTSHPMHRTSSRPTTTRSPPACWPRSKRSAGTISSTRSSPPDGGSSGSASASTWPSGSRPTRRCVERVRELAVLQADQGYLADAILEPDGTIRLREHNCAIFHVAEGTPAACQAELALFSEVLGADVVREQHIASGDRCCSYRIARNRRAPSRAVGVRPGRCALPLARMLPAAFG